MPPPAHTKPENVLKRAQELIAVDQTQAALQILYEHVTSKRSRNSPIPSLEPVMLLFVELCVDLRKGKLAKDGLYQYKNVAQNTNVGTIELVLKKFIELADQKVAEAQSKADAVQSTLETTGSTSNIDDLEASETPESILLSTVSGEQSKDRTDRAIVTPWLKFLWETYRTVLDILRNNARLEVMYQSTALQAFQFCLKFTRKTEFRRLCELLRNHVQNAAKYSSQMNAIDLSDPDTLQRHLDTRFQQLNVAVDLELWQEGFRSVEDIHTLLSLSKRQPKNIMMANYYEKLTRIFLVSENYLFHAAAWNRYYNLLRASMNAVATGQATKKDSPATTEADITKAASFVLLSALAIPVISTQRSRGALVDIDEAKKNKNVRLTNLLNMPKAPTRASLFKDALSKGLLKRAKPEIRELYNILEVDFHPLSICKKISPILQQIASDPEMEKYVAPLQQVILTRLFQQLSQVYDTVDLQFVITLAQFPAPYEISSAMIEKFVMNGCKKGDLSIRVDHAAGFISFDSDVFSAKTPASAAPEKSSSVQKLQSTPSEIVRTQLSRLSQALWTACQYVDPAFNQARADAKKAAYERAAVAAEKERAELLARREIIDQKKAAASSALALRQKEEQNRKKQQELRLADEERKRLEKEQKERDEKRRAAEMARIRQEDMKKQLDDLKASGKGLNIKEEDLEDLDSTRLRAMKLAQLEKEKSDLSEKLRIVGKRIDHLERAYRKREIELLNDDFERQKVEDQEIHARIKEETIQAAKEKHRYDLALKHRLSRIVSFYEDFTDEIKGKRHDEFEKRRKTAEQELQKAIDKRKKEYREAKLAERRALEEAAEREREAEEAAEREAAEKAAKEEELRKRLAEEKAKREESRRKMDEIAELQRKREEEAEERRRNKMAGAGRTESPAPAATGSTRAPLVLSGRTGVPSWREREAMKKASGGGDSERSATPSAARDESPAARTQSPAADGPSKYTPPARRGAAPADSAEKPKEEVQRWRPSGRGRGGVAGERTDSSTRTESGNRTTGGRWRD